MPALHAKRSVSFVAYRMGEVMMMDMGNYGSSMGVLGGCLGLSFSTAVVL